MQKYSDVVLDKNGKAVQGAVVTVVTYPAGDPATIYAADGGPAVASVKTDQYGRFSFYAASGHYSFTVDGTGITSITYNDVTLFDPKDLAAGDGAKLSGFQQAGSGAVTRTVLDKLREIVNVKDFGAKGDGVADDTASIQAAISSGQVVNFPPGQYRTTAPINWTNQHLRGAVTNGALSTASNQTMILCDGTHAAFRYYHPDNYVSHGGSIENFNIYFADGVKPAIATARANAIGILIDGAHGYPGFHQIKNITVRGGMWALYDSSGSWMGLCSHIHSEFCFAGIYKRNGTTHTFDACYHGGGHCGIWLQDVLGVVLNASAVDLCDTSITDYYPVFIENSNVVWNGADFENLGVVGDYKAAIFINGPHAKVQINGARFLDAQITAGAENYLIKADSGAALQLNAVDFSTPALIGSGGVFAYAAAEGGASIVMEQCTLPTLTGGTPGAAYSSLATTGSLDYNNCVAVYAWFGNSRRIEKSMRISAVLDVPAVAANGSYSATYDFPGAAVGDFTQASMSVPTPGLILDAQARSADQVTVTFYNVTSAAIDPASATIRIRVVPQ